MQQRPRGAAPSTGQYENGNCQDWDSGCPVYPRLVLNLSGCLKILQPIEFFKEKFAQSVRILKVNVILDKEKDTDEIIGVVLLGKEF